MQAVLDFINKHHYDIFIPLTALAVLRIIVCRAQLKKIASLREKKGAYHAVGGNYTEIGAWLGTLPGFVLALAAPSAARWWTCCGWLSSPAKPVSMRSCPASSPVWCWP